MKKVILGVIVGIVLFWSIAYAAPGDVTITFTIPAAKVADFKAGFLARCPIRMIEDPNKLDASASVPEFTDKDWHKWVGKWSSQEVWRVYDQGVKLLAKKTAVTDPNVIQVSTKIEK